MTGQRERFLDVLRAAALARVIVYHMFGLAWLSFAFPAMGVMFAVGGSLVARSLDNAPAGTVIGNRLRRLLPAYWLFGIVVLAAMLIEGELDHPGPVWWLTWLVPFADPPGSEWVAPATEVLWYLVTYLWLVVLSPLALWAYRRWPVRTALVPLAVLGVAELVSFDGVLTNVATFGACWVAGFAHRDGALRRMSTGLLVLLAGVCLGLGTGWAVSHSTPDLNEIPVGQALYSLGFVLLVMRLPVTLDWLRRRPALDWCLRTVNARAVTIYLWHNPAIAVCFAVGDALQVWRFGELGYFAVAVAMLVAAVRLVGWVENVWYIGPRATPLGFSPAPVPGHP
ncbi:MAG TPA: acyltransferase [Micromonosporaceae bacterium]|nr:acyltransferase [Micromonosporaceae bacterium]